MVTDPELHAVLTTVHHLFYQTYSMPLVIRLGTMTPVFGTKKKFFKQNKKQQQTEKCRI